RPPPASKHRPGRNRTRRGSAPAIRSHRHVWGSGSASLAKLSAAHRAAFWRSSVVALAQAFNLGAPRLALQRQHRGAILERVGKLANRGDGFWCPGRKPAGLMLTIDFDVADDVGGGLGMPGIENAAQLLIVLHEAVGLINQQGRADFLHIATRRRPRDVRGKFWPSWH